MLVYIFKSHKIKPDGSSELSPGLITLPLSYFFFTLGGGNNATFGYIPKIWDVGSRMNVALQQMFPVWGVQIRNLITEKIVTLCKLQ